MSRLKGQGLVSFKSIKVWNKDSDLVRVRIFKYQSPEALKACMPIWKEIEEDLFPGISVKTISYRGVVTDLWRAVGS